MHPYVKLHKLLGVVLVILSILTMLLCPVDSRTCIINTRTFYSDLTKGNLRIEGKRVVASKCEDLNCSNRAIQMVPIDGINFLLYDPHVKMFICWDPHYMRLVAKRNPRKIAQCKFVERISEKRSPYTRYTSTNPKNGTSSSTVEMRFNKMGVFATPSFIRRCSKRLKKREPYYVTTSGGISAWMDLMHNNVSHHVDLSRCGETDFLLKNVGQNCNCQLREFCGQMRKIKRHHHLAEELSKFCQNDWNKSTTGRDCGVDDDAQY